MISVDEGFEPYQAYILDHIMR